MGRNIEEFDDCQWPPAARFPSRWIDLSAIIRLKCGLFFATSRRPVMPPAAQLCASLMYNLRIASGYVLKTGDFKNRRLLGCSRWLQGRPKLLQGIRPAASLTLYSGIELELRSGSLNYSTFSSTRPP